MRKKGNAIRNFNNKRYKRLQVCVSFHISYPNTSFSFNFSLTFFSVPINSETWFLLDASNSDSLASKVCYQQEKHTASRHIERFHFTGGNRQLSLPWYIAAKKAQTYDLKTEHLFLIEEYLQRKLIPPPPKKIAELIPSSLLPIKSLHLRNLVKLRFCRRSSPFRPPSPNTSKVLPPIELRSHMLGTGQKY